MIHRVSDFSIKVQYNRKYGILYLMGITNPYMNIPINQQKLHGVEHLCSQCDSHINHNKTLRSNVFYTPFWATFISSTSFFSRAISPSNFAMRPCEICLPNSSFSLSKVLHLAINCLPVWLIEYKSKAYSLPCHTEPCHFLITFLPKLCVRHVHGSIVVSL